MTAILFIVVMVCTTPVVYVALRFSLNSDWAPLLAVVGTWTWLWLLLQAFAAVSA